MKLFFEAADRPGGGLRTSELTRPGFRHDVCSTVQALLATGGAGDPDADQGLDYLAGIQGSDGGVGGAGPTAAHNANSTGLAGQAFLAGGRSAQARAAQGYLRGLQYGCTYPAAFRGGIAYDRAAFTAAAAKGATVQDQDRRATSQALLALAGTPLYAVSATGADATAPDLACAAPTSTTTSPTTTSSSPSSSTSPSTSSRASASSGCSGSTGSRPVLRRAYLLWESAPIGPGR